MGTGFLAGTLLPFTLELTLFLGLSVLLLYLLKK